MLAARFLANTPAHLGEPELEAVLSRKLREVWHNVGDDQVALPLCVGEGRRQEEGDDELLVPQHNRLESVVYVAA